MRLSPEIGYSYHLRYFAQTVVLEGAFSPSPPVTTALTTAAYVCVLTSKNVQSYVSSAGTRSVHCLVVSSALATVGDALPTLINLLTLVLLLTTHTYHHYYPR